MNDTNFLPDVSSNISFMLDPNMSNESSGVQMGNQPSMNSSNLNDLILLEDQLKLAQEKIEQTDIKNKDWKNYTSSKLGLSVEYPTDVHLQKEGKETRFDPDKDLKIGSIEKDGFSISPSNYGQNSTDFTNVVLQAKESHLNMNLDDSYLIIVEDITPMSIRGDIGLSYLISLIDRGLEKSLFVSNNTFLYHNDNIYRFVFVTNTDQYNNTNAIFNHLLNSINWGINEANIRSVSNVLANQSFLQNNISTAIVNHASGNNTATIETTQGPIKIKFYPDIAPNHVKNFQDLASKGFYDGVIFHRIVPGFVLQAGDPNTKNSSLGRDTWGTGGPGYTINQEFNTIPHERGILSMARMTDPNSAGSQFFIVLNNSEFLDGQYTVFGKITEGMEVVDKIANVTTNSMDQPMNQDLARINKLMVN
ncbi:peptidylprolyl isomerase [Candidatus Nitrosocosmicus arcticus]|nr:peptidylprolyl isomerase [Candidatus Nitrosocosmicus arcticus]